MKRAFSQTINDLSGTPLRAGGSFEALLTGLEEALPQIDAASAAIIQQCLQSRTGAALTLGAACADALIAPLPGENELALGERVKRMALAMRIHAGGLIEIDAEERDLIKSCVTKYFKGSLIPARIAAALEAA